MFLTVRVKNPPGVTDIWNQAQARKSDNSEIKLSNWIHHNVIADEITCGTKTLSGSNQSAIPGGPVALTFKASASDSYNHKLNYQFQYRSTDPGTNTSWKNFASFANVSSGALKTASVTVYPPESGDQNLCNGSYEFRLYVTDAGGSAPAQYCPAATHTITVPHRITLSCGASPQVGAIPLFVRLTASANDNFATFPGSGSHTLTYTWDFDDGTPGVTTTDASVVHAYTTPGDKLARVTVSHAANALLPCPISWVPSQTCSVTINVESPGEGGGGEVSP